MEIGVKVGASSGTRQPRILVVCGLSREAKLVGAEDAVVIAGGGDARALGRKLEAVDPLTLDAVVSFGLAGALAPALKVGDVLAPATVVDLAGEHYATSEAIRDAWKAASGSVRDSDEGAILLGVDRPALTVADKATLRRRAHGASAVDMESHVAAAWAARHKLPFAVLRVISDAADRSLPAVAGRAMRPDGSIDVMGVLGGLLRDPRQLPGLIATARDAGAAFKTLGRVGGLLRGSLGLDL